MEKISKNLSAIIWDYDGTLVDSRQKNLTVTRRIVSQILKRDVQDFQALATIEAYHHSQSITVNWRSFYKDQFGMNDEQVDSAGAMWTAFQQDDKTPSPLFSGIKDLLSELAKYRHAIVSQNSQLIIKRTLQDEGIDKYFDHIVGYEEVDLSRQKPHPAGLLACIDHLQFRNSGDILYIGDHEADVQCAQNANAELANNVGKIISVAALYGYGHDTNNWESKPDFVATNHQDIANIILSPFR